MMDAEKIVASDIDEVEMTSGTIQE